MIPRLFRGVIEHQRHGVPAHYFRYPISACGFEVDDLPRLARSNAWFGHNTWRPLSIHDRDFLSGSGSLRERVTQTLTQQAPDHPPIGRIWLVTLPQWFGLGFRPVSFYAVYPASTPTRDPSPEGNTAPCSVIAEVNNTFGERYPYVLQSLSGTLTAAFTPNTPKRSSSARFTIVRVCTSST